MPPANTTALKGDRVKKYLLEHAVFLIACVNAILGVLLLLFWVDLYNSIWIAFYAILISSCLVSMYIFLKYLYISIRERKYKAVFMLFINIVFVVLTMIFL